MGKFSSYNIPLRSLSDKAHHYEYVLDNKYFSLIGDDSLDIKRGEVVAKLTVKRIASTFEFNFELNGEVQISCDRCLDDMPIEIVSKNRLFVKFGTEYSEESDEIVIIPEEEGEINVAWFLYEFISLSIPMKHVHAPGKCNTQMSSKLDKHKAISIDDDDDDDIEDDDDNLED